MRYIDITPIQPPANWLDLAKAELGNNYEFLWTYLRNDFETLVSKKCWYSESCNIGSVNPIDHFRPKAARVKLLTPQYATLNSTVWARINPNSRNGYPFLKFHYPNYRYSCYIVNTSNKRESTDGVTKGKSNFFPLRLGSAVGTSLADINAEAICLLDPCNIDDPGYLTFNEFGKIEPHRSILDSSWEYCKVVVSIELYHLHYPSFVEKRVEVWDLCKEKIELAATIYPKTIKTAEEENALIAYIKDVNRMIDKKREFSAVAIDCIFSYKKKYPWLDLFFPSIRLTK